MRPAQLTPENIGGAFRDSAQLAPFNEAGAINAGKHWLDETATECELSFNEAGAINAGKLV